MKRKIVKLLFLIPLTVLSLQSNAQVTIGSGGVPNKGALLDIKEQKATTVGGVIAAHGGILLPRVELENNKEIIQFLEANVPNYESVEKPEYKGLFVYHIGNAELAAEAYLWSGTEWEQFGTKLSIKPQITSLQCNNANISPSVLTGGVPLPATPSTNKAVFMSVVRKA